MPAPQVVAARKYLGVRFRHRGRSSTGLDCVGLVMRSWYDCGVKLADRTIQAVTTCKVKAAGGATIAGTVDNTLGTFTPAAQWGTGGYTWSGTFDCWVRFNSDEFDVTMKTHDIATTDVNLLEAIAYA